ncbi:MAG: nucleoside recognition domain-containing protein [Clostridia bacterium]|nr:nucleoside recognition domain-containing protein [Clostridia bacterium]
MIAVLIVTVLIVAIAKKVNCYNAFVCGAKESFSLAISLFPYISAIFIALSLLELSGVQDKLTQLFAPVFNLVGIPTELTPLVLVKPFSGSGSLGILSNIYQQYGADSYVSRCASIIMGSSETVFYILVVYFASTNIRKTGKAVAIALISTLIGTICACLLCKFM